MSNHTVTIVHWLLLQYDVFFCGLDIRVPEIMKTYLPQAILLQQYRKMLCQKSRFHPFSHFIYINKVQIFLTVTVTAQPSIFFLLKVQPDEQILKWLY